MQAAPPVLVAPPSTPAPEPSPAAKPAVKPEPGPPATPAPTPAPPAPAPKPGASKAATAPQTPPATEPTAPRPAPPQISPRLTASELAEYQRKTEKAIAAAEHNLERAYGRQLNSDQLDLVEKIRGFLAQAREAARSADWVRARNLAEKAEVLSVELARSL